MEDPWRSTDIQVQFIKKILWNITKKDRVPELIYNMTNNSNYDFINMYYSIYMQKSHDLASDQVY